MDEFESSFQDKSDEGCNSSFENLRQSGNQFQQLPDYNPFTIQEVPQLSDIPEKSLTQSVIDTYKMYCSNLKTIKTNLAYNLRHSNLDIFTGRQKVVLNKEQQITLLGKVHQNKSQDKKKFYQEFNNVIWLTYRSGIYGVETDNGWGCMIRVCQMVLAQTFKRVAPKLALKQIIDYFRDTPQAYFSLTRICQKGGIKQRWTSSVQIFSLFKNLIQKFQNIVLSIDLHSCYMQFANLKQLDYAQYPMLLFISNRLGKNKIQPQYRDHMLQIMKIPYFVGIVGGNGGQALYLIGHYCQKFIFMDPHYVQESQYDQEGKKTSTYFQSQPYSIDIDSLAPSVAVNFLVKSKEQYMDLLQRLYKLQTKHYPWICFEILSQQLKKSIKPQIHKDDQFQLMK